MRGQEVTYDPVTASVAVAAARQLAAPFKLPGLPLDVEMAIHSREVQEQPRQFIDPVEVAILIVGIADLACGVYREREKNGKAPARETLTRIVQGRWRESSDLTGAEERIIEVVVAEIIEATGDRDRA